MVDFIVLLADIGYILWFIVMPRTKARCQDIFWPWLWVWTWTQCRQGQSIITHTSCTPSDARSDASRASSVALIAASVASASSQPTLARRRRGPRRHRFVLKRSSSCEISFARTPSSATSRRLTTAGWTRRQSFGMIKPRRWGRLSSTWESLLLTQQTRFLAILHISTWEAISCHERLIKSNYEWEINNKIVKRSCLLYTSDAADE